MIIYEHKPTGVRAVLIEKTSDTVVLETIDSKERKEVSLATLRRWWSEVEVESESSASTEADEKMEMSRTIKILETLFDKLNEIYFENKLSRPVITIQSTPRAYGHCSTKKIWKSDDAESYEINIGAEYINRQLPQTAATMCHEMVHLYCLENDIRDTCQNGRYHNATFKREAEARDLEIGYDRANGYTHTTATEAFIDKLTSSGFDMSIKFARVTPMKSERSRRSKTQKYSCPVCGQSVRSIRELNLICGVCETAMEREE